MKAERINPEPQVVITMTEREARRVWAAASNLPANARSETMTALVVALNPAVMTVGVWTA